MVVKQTFGSGRSGRKHKAWGASPRIASKQDESACESGRQPLSPAFAGFVVVLIC
jgi:hypothetical protein